MHPSSNRRRNIVNSMQHCQPVRNHPRIHLRDLLQTSAEEGLTMQATMWDSTSLETDRHPSSGATESNSDVCLWGMLLRWGAVSDQSLDLHGHCWTQIPEYPNQTKTSSPASPMHRLPPEQRLSPCTGRSPGENTYGSFWKYPGKQRRTLTSHVCFSRSLGWLPSSMGHGGRATRTRASGFFGGGKPVTLRPLVSSAQKK